MGFYSPATLIQDAKRHGIRFKSPCVVESDWKSMVIDDNTIRVGLKNVKSVGQDSAQFMLSERSIESFDTIRNFLLRTEFKKDELRALANAGALNVLCGDRRKALWEIEASIDKDDLFSNLMVEESDNNEGYSESEETYRLPLMTYVERLNADYQSMGLTVGAHPMAWLRKKLPKSILTAEKLGSTRDGTQVRVAGAVICRQRPGTAKGVVFVSLEDETGVSNCIVYGPLFERFRLVIVKEPFLVISGKLQNVEGVIHVKAERIAGLGERYLPAGASHDFH